jgi:hypothetical protein
VRHRGGALGIAPGRNRPVFVDDTGWRRWWFRGGGLVACALCIAYLALVVFGLTGHGPLSGLRLPILAPQHHGAAPGHGGSTGSQAAGGSQTANGARIVSEVDPAAAAANTTTSLARTTSTTTPSVGQGRAPTATTVPPDPPSSPTTVATHGNNGNAGGNGKGKGTPPSDPGKANDAPGHTTNGKAAH